MCHFKDSNGNRNNEQQNSKSDSVVANLLPRRAMSQPVSGIDVSEPTATQRSIRPKVLLLSEKSV